MKVTVLQKDKISVMILEGSVLQESVPILQKGAEQVLGGNTNQVVLDLSTTQYISSMGLAVISNMKKKLTSQKGDLKIARVTGLIARVLETTNLSKKVAIYETVAEAVEAFN